MEKYKAGDKIEFIKSNNYFPRGITRTIHDRHGILYVPYQDIYSTTGTLILMRSLPPDTYIIFKKSKEKPSWL